MNDAAHLRPNQMNDHDFEMQHKRIDATYPKGGSLKALREQALAKLFDESGWTVEQLAEREGVSRARASQMVLFGRFLAFSTQGGGGALPTNLPEKKFRGYWTATDQKAKDQHRYRAVLEMIEADAGLPADLKDRIVEEYADGEWYLAGDIAEEFEVEERHVLAIFASLKNSKNYHCERRKNGGRPDLRIVRGEGRKVELTILQKELGPIIKALEAEGKKNMATASPGTVAALTHDLKKALDKLAR